MPYFLAGLILSSMPELQDENGEPHFLLDVLEIWFVLEILIPEF